MNIGSMAGYVYIHGKIRRHKKEFKMFAGYKYTQN